MKTAGFLYALAAALTWGVVYAISQKVLMTTKPLVFLFLGYSLAALLTLPFILIQWGSVKNVLLASKPLWGWILAGEIFVFLANFFILSSVKELGAPTASILEISYPFFVAIFTALLFGSRVSAQFWIGALLIFVGSAVIIKAS
jgi:drug/metabolite transporter (DMT)-like permease